MTENKLASAHMPLLDRLWKGADCVVFLDGAPEPAADVADMLRKAAEEIERLTAQLAEASGRANAHWTGICHLRAALTDARDALRNDFEPDNQSLAYKRATAALEQKADRP